MDHGGSVDHRGSIGDGSDLSDGSGVSYGCYYFRDDLYTGFFAYDRVKSIVGIGRVVDDALGTVRFNKRVRALYYISVAGLVLALGVSAKGVLNVVSEAVFRVGVVFLNFGDRGGVGELGDGCGGVRHGGGVV